MLVGENGDLQTCPGLESYNIHLFMCVTGPFLIERTGFVKFWNDYLYIVVFGPLVHTLIQDSQKKYSSML